MALTIRSEAKNRIVTLLNTAVFQEPIAGKTTWGTAATRRLKLWPAVDPSIQPACFLVQHREGYDNSGVGSLVRRWMYCCAWCYARTDDPSIVGDDLLDTMTAAIETALASDDPIRDELTLNGLVYWVKIDMSSSMYIRDPGDIDGQALLVLPITVLIP